jgi:hypothetical protein
MTPGLVRALSVLMYFLLFREAPLLKDCQEARCVKHRDDVAALAQMFVDTGASAELVDGNIDPAILAAIGFHESRYRQVGDDGDPRYTYLEGNQRRWVRVGQSVGPMQISRGAPQWLSVWPRDIAVKWEGLTVTQLRDPETNVRFAYDNLDQWKRRCGGSPAVWIDAYGRGRCPGSISSVGRVGKTRCLLVEWFVKRLERELPGYARPTGWTCATGVRASESERPAPVASAS